MSNYAVESPLERSIANQVNALIGNDDVNLKTIMKLSMMSAKHQAPDEMGKIIEQIKEYNLIESELVYEEYELVADFVGDKISLYNKQDVQESEERKEAEKDSGCQLCKSG